MENLIKMMDETTSELLQTIDSFTQEQINIVPFEGSWTAGQVAEHLLKSESGIPVLLLGNKMITNRPADENTGMIEDMFLDFTTKMKSPPDILPSNEPKEKEAFYNALKANRAEIKCLCNTVDLTQTLADFLLPNMGALTGIEWVTFLVCHSKRHIHQLKNIRQKLG